MDGGLAVWLEERISLASVALTAVILTSVLYLLVRRPRLPPGPTGLPYIGYFPFLEEEPHVQLSQLAKKYGDVFSFTVTGQLYVHLNSIEVIKEAFVTKGDFTNGRGLDFSLLNWIDDGEGIAQTEGHVWKEDRRFFLQAAKEFGFGKVEHEDYMHEMIRRMLQMMQKTNEKPFDILPILALTTINTVLRIFHNHKCYDGVDDPKFKRLADNSFAVLREFVGSRQLLIGPLYNYLVFRLSPRYGKLTKAKSVLYEIADELIEENKNTYDKSHIRDFSDRYFSETEKRIQKGENSANPFTQEKLRGVIINVFLDGMLSTSETLYHFIRHLSMNKAIQETIQKELDEVVNRDRLPSWRDRSQLPYTDAAIVEFHRMTTTFPLGAAHKCVETMTLKGYDIPKGTMLLSNLWAAHNDPKTFPNPSKCDPRRFLTTDGKRIRRDTVIPFGTGKRSCVGESLATMEIFNILTAILQNFTLCVPLGTSLEDFKKQEEFKICAFPRPKTE